MFELSWAVLLKLAAFVIASAVIVRGTWPSLRGWRNHGLWRLFAFEAIVLLVLVNMDSWFDEPLALHQLVSWLVLGLSVALAVSGVYTLHSQGKPGAARADPSLIGVERTTRLVTDGVYRHIRHPMYSSLLFLAWGAFFKSFSWFALILVLVATLALVATAWAEEGENCQFFGPAYRAYMGRTKRFIPYVM